MSDLGPKPEPQTEPGEPHPGGVDASPHFDDVETDASDAAPIARDLDPQDKPAAEHPLPDELNQPEDTTTEATRGDGDVGLDADKESPA